MARPAKEAGHAESPLENGSLRLRERGLAAIWPREDFCSVVRGEYADGVLVLADVLQLLHPNADVVVQLRHPGFLFRPAVLGVTRRFILWRKVRDDVHARRVEPNEERFVIALGLVDEFEGEGSNLVVHGFHALRIEWTGIFDLLFADDTPTWLVCRVGRVGGPAMNHVAGADDIQKIL